MLRSPADDRDDTAPPPRYETPSGYPCPRTVRSDGGVDGSGACHACGSATSCPLFDPWADGLLD